MIGPRPARHPWDPPVQPPPVWRLAALRSRRALVLSSAALALAALAIASVVADHLGLIPPVHPTVVLQTVYVSPSPTPTPWPWP